MTPSGFLSTIFYLGRDNDLLLVHLGADLISFFTRLLQIVEVHFQDIECNEVSFLQKLLLYFLL